jgi:uncharacterized RDD family membrane protein YckC
MKCPNCGFNSFDYLEECKKCKLPLNPSQEHKSLYKKSPKKSVTGSVSPDETRVESARGYRNQGTGAEEPAVSDSILENIPNTTVDTEPDLEQDAPDAYGDGPEHEVQSGGIKSRGQRRALHSDAGAGIKSERALHSDAYGDGLEHEVQSGGKDKIRRQPEHEVRTGDIKLERALYAELESHAPDPVLYSESNVLQSATNLPGMHDSKEDSESYSIAGLKPRAVAFLIDLVIVGLIAYLTIRAGFFIIGDTAIKPGELSRVFLPIYALLFFLASTYFVFLHYYAGRTLGKMAVGIRIISSEGREVGLWESFMRWVGYYISAVFLLAGFIWSVFDQDSQAWHDKIAGTYVVIG